MISTICGAAVDWGATGDMLSGVGSMAGAGAVIFAAWKGADTFKQWRRQKHHERCMVVAEELLTLAYKLKRAFDAIRSPGMLASEIEEMKVKLRESGHLKEETSNAEAGILTTAQATLSRTEFYKPLFEELLNRTPVAKAIFGDNLAAQLNVFWMQRARVVTAANTYARSYHERELRREEDEQRRRERHDRTEGVIWAGGALDGVDQVANAIDAAISSMEAELLPIIRDQPT